MNATQIADFAAAIEAAKTLTHCNGRRTDECTRIAVEMNAAGVPENHPLRAAVHEVYFWEFFAA